MSDIRDVMRGASRCLYVCRPWEQKYARPGSQRTLCVDCEAPVAVWSATLIDRRRKANEAGVEIEIVCDSCAEKLFDESPATLVSMPTDDEIKKAR